MKLIFALFVVIVLIVSLLVFPSYANESPIPEWIRNNAIWWTEGKITDSDFLSGIQYLINNDILIVPSADYSEKSSDVPKWLKNTVKWWAENKVSDDEFLNSLSYLIKIGLLVVDKPMQISSDAFENNGFIPTEYTCDGLDISPKISFSNIPRHTKSLALIMDDPDAPSGTFVHWIVWNIMPTKNGFEKGESLVEPQGVTSFGKQGYGGPCPPSGTHRYFFKLYALDTILDLDTSANVTELENAMKDHIIATAELVGKYSRN